MILDPPYLRVSGLIEKEVHFRIYLQKRKASKLPKNSKGVPNLKDIKYRRRLYTRRLP